jgi:hypothetical protein
VTRRPVSLALVLALVVAALGAAAELVADAGNAQAGGDVDLVCEDGVTVAWQTQLIGGDLYVTGVTVSQINKVGCNGHTLTVVLTGSGGNSIASGATTIDSTSEAVNTVPDVPVSDVHDVHLLIKK